MNDHYQTFALEARDRIARFERTAKPVDLSRTPPLCETWEERQERFAEIRSQKLEQLRSQKLKQLRTNLEIYQEGVAEASNVRVRYLYTKFCKETYQKIKDYETQPEH